MRVRLLVATIVAAFVSACSLPAALADDSANQAVVLRHLAFAGAPLTTASASIVRVPANTSSLPNPGATPAAPVAPSREVASPALPSSPAVNPELPNVPNPLDLFGNLDPRQWAGDILNAVLTTIGKALLEAMRSFTDWALGLGDSSLNFVTRTPAEGTYDSTTVRSLWDFSRALANAALAVIVMWGGFNIIVKEHTRSPYDGAMELMPRVVLAALAANLTLEFVKLLIDTNNALAVAVGEVGLPGYDQAGATQEGVALIFTALAYGVVSLLLVLQMLMRLALIDVLLVMGPVMAVLWVLPQTQGWTRWWTNLLPITVFQQAVQVMVLRLGSALMVELTPGNLSNAILTLLLGIAVCWLTLKVPSLLRGQVHHAGLGTVVSLVVIGRAAGALAARGGGAGGAAASSAGSGRANRPAAEGS